MVNVNLLYPIGSIYISVNSKNPSEIFGGTWERIKGKMLFGVDENDTDFSASGKTGGEKEVTLTVEQMPKHNHLYDKGSNVNAAGYLVQVGYAGGVPSGSKGNVIDTGGGQAHNNMPPYFTCYIWYRTA